MSLIPLAVPAPWKKDTIESYLQDINRVISAMQDDLERGWALEDLADIAIMSPYHFNRVFRQITGVPPCRFLWMLRLEAAKHLLLTTNQQVIEICYEVGYNSLGTFTRRFTQLVGVPPLQFRRMASRIRVDSILEFQPLLDHSPCPVSSACSTPAQIEIQLTAPAGFDGIALVGVYSEPIPQGQPLCCAVLRSGDTGCVSGNLSDGRYFVFAAGFTCHNDPLDYFLSQRIYRGLPDDGPTQITAGISDGAKHVKLRRPYLTDPPLLSCLPALIQHCATANAH